MGDASNKHNINKNGETNVACSVLKLAIVNRACTVFNDLQPVEKAVLYHPIVSHFIGCLCYFVRLSKTYQDLCSWMLQPLLVSPQTVNVPHNTLALFPRGERTSTILLRKLCDNFRLAEN
jgi:hypothetical protein